MNIKIKQELLSHELRVELLESWADAMSALDEKTNELAILVGEGGDLQARIENVQDNYTRLLASVLGLETFPTEAQYENELDWFRWQTNYGTEQALEESRGDIFTIDDVPSFAEYLRSVAVEPAP